MSQDRSRDGDDEKDRGAEKKIRHEVERGPTAAHQGAGKSDSGATSARGMQTGAEGDLTARRDGKPGRSDEEASG
jgi:hypothetical protein